MFLISKKWLSLNSTIVFLSGISGLAFAASSQELVNARQETQKWTTYALSPFLRASDITVVVDGGTATLSGLVDKDVNRDLAKQIALGVTGIDQVDNQIQVKADYKPISTDRNYGQVIDDVSISAAIRSKLQWSKLTDEKTIDVKTTKGSVLLSGTASTGKAKIMASRLAAGTHGVTSVTNNILVSNVAATTGMAKSSTLDVGNNISDTWITTKVKSTFLYSRNVAGNDIDVSTTAGIVTLKGRLESGAERALAIELAQNVRGVKNVQANELVN